MISSVQNVSTTLTGFGRNASGGVRNPAHAATASPADVRVVGQVENNESIGMELPQRDGLMAAQLPTAGWDIQAPGAEDPVQEVAGLITQKAAVRSNIAVIKTKDRMLGSLLDVIG